MAITETSRHEMLIALESQIGKEATMTLAEHLPPVGWADVATRADVEGLAAATRADIERSEASTRADIERLAVSTRGDMHCLRADMNTLAADLRADMARLEVRLTEKMVTQNRILALSLTTTMLTIIGMAFVGPS